MAVEETPAPNGLKMALKRATTRIPRQQTVLKNTRSEEHLRTPGELQDLPPSCPGARGHKEHRGVEEEE